MQKAIMTEMLVRDLEKLKAEVLLYPTDEALWITAGSISNSAGNLCLHLVGNLNHFVGFALGKTGYTRERDREFSDKGQTREQLAAAIEATIAVVKTSLEPLPESILEETFPLEKHGEWVTTGYMLTHLVTHLNYHLGQVNYHRRLLTP